LALKAPNSCPGCRAGGQASPGGRLWYSLFSGCVIAPGAGAEGPARRPAAPNPGPWWREGLGPGAGAGGRAGGRGSGEKAARGFEYAGLNSALWQTSLSYQTTLFRSPPLCLISPIAGCPHSAIWWQCRQYQTLRSCFSLLISYCLMPSVETNSDADAVSSVSRQCRRGLGAER
jgi:hypothetical protein